MGHNFPLRSLNKLKLQFLNESKGVVFGNVTVIVEFFMFRHNVACWNVIKIIIEDFELSEG